MNGNRTYLKVEVTVIASTVIALAIVVAASGCILGNMTVGTAYNFCVGAAISSILLSLIAGCHGIIKSLSLLDCEQWNIRMVRTGFIIQSVLLGTGLLLYSISLVFIR